MNVAHNEVNSVYPPGVLPDGQGGFTACPTLLTEAEVVRYLRLDTLGRKDPRRSLQYLRERRLVKPTRISNVNFYLRASLDEFLTTMTARTCEGKGKRR